MLLVAGVVGLRNESTWPAVLFATALTLAAVMMIVRDGLAISRECKERAASYGLCAEPEAHGGPRLAGLHALGLALMARSLLHLMR